MEQQIKDAVGLGSPQLQPETPVNVQPDPPPPPVTIHDFGKLLLEYEPTK
jgi:hypothetical protein